MKPVTAIELVSVPVASNPRFAQQPEPMPSAMASNLNFAKPEHPSADQGVKSRVDKVAANNRNI